MQKRDAVIAATLKQTAWAGWQSEAIAGDASTRRYFRLSNGEASVILMDAPPETCHDTGRFVEIATHLTAHGFAAPEILHRDLSLGIVVLSDLGLSDFVRHLNASPHEEALLYENATDVLVRLSQTPAPQMLSRLTPEVGARMIHPLGEHYGVENLRQIQDLLLAALQSYAPTADTLSLRDYHAENLIWRPQLTGIDRVGLLDFQDAFIAPAGYDLASLLRDARRDVDPRVADRLISAFAEEIRMETAQFSAQFATLAVQRNLRILGIFAKLVGQDRKPKYLPLMNRVWQSILTDLHHDALSDLRLAVLQNVPAPDQDHLKRFAV
ncbi:aminoglycoside phosphotransferase family protein [Yoonia litorea]|uniref:Aminoglycoside phosphotransferase domain-containing protein n=1 Tax=Yoonia litorea TaxID=1123755 RepID=A0A1I6MVT6_9RHOB|nr:phosphotransferase [Yoonia litorea]SFS19835.1 hypothetical protein SAMN05444714_2371 [Yoonia litorea]